MSAHFTKDSRTRMLLAFAAADWSRLPDVGGPGSADSQQERKPVNALTKFLRRFRRCDHDWQERGFGFDLYQQCWLCGKLR